MEERAVAEGMGEGATEAENNAGWPRLAFACEQAEDDVSTSHSWRFASTRQLNVVDDKRLNPGPVRSWAQAHLASSLQTSSKGQGGDESNGAHESA